MPFKTLFAAAVLTLSGGAVSAQGLLVHNARGLTLDERGRVIRFDAMQVGADGRVIAIGKLGELPAGDMQRVDAGGRVLMPGLIDAHGHVLSLGAARRSLQLRDTADLTAALAAIKTHAEARPEVAWITGGGWNQAVWKLDRFPTAAELDTAESQRPVFLTRVDGHAGWANGRALQLAGITRDTPDPAGGRIERDASGEPTGVLVDAAMGLVERQIPAEDAAELAANLDTAERELLSLGITSAHDAGISAAADQLLRQRAAAGQLQMRIYGMARGSDEAFMARLRAAGPLPDLGNGHYALRAVKLFADGALGSRGAALLAPYADAPQTRGLLFRSDAELLAQMRAAAKAGFQVNVHAIGDAANRQALAGYEALAKEMGSRSTQLRHRIEHAQVIALTDIPRFAKNQVIASIQPTHATSDMNMAEDRVGAQRIQGAYAWQRLLKSGASLACGSDFPVEEPSPWAGLYAAITREDAAGKPVGGWYRQQALNPVQALDCFTRGAAFAAHAEKDLGLLTPGHRADFILADRDPLTSSPAALLKTRVLQTWVGGRLVFTREP
ncbi:putative amidohydrolase YtcJ [Pelomonas saccharophila]|uniref:Amidohydrolase YtcJ n=1 Tax=Roseateles saccharophilus TaxID=304 RepID=A0ABU1YRH1_ROSSA|nr:amidohydrolase [Roseateles saccharophilus]MDR7271463.1 putative amidohydrolase YtcJ [Roseateles saccharophilus]